MDLPQSKPYNIQELYEWYTRQDLSLNPHFQRREVWPDKARSYLIDTILEGMPIPKIFMRQKINAATKKSMREIVDGQQRLRAIFSYVDNEFPVMKVHNTDYGGLRFGELPEDVQGRFLGYQVSADVLVGATDEDVLEIFSRINSFSAPLNAFEQFNAKFFGLFKKTVFRLGREHYAFWTTNDILNDRQIARMAEAALAADLVSVMLVGITASTKSHMRNLFEKYEDYFDEMDQLIADFRQVLSTIAFLFPEGLSKTKFCTVTNFYSLFVLIYTLEHSVPQLPNFRLTIGPRSAPRIHNALMKANVILSDPELYPEYSKFVEASTRRTTHMISRKQRHEFLLSLVQGETNDNND